MTPINLNWTDENGNHAGGQSLGDNFTIDYLFEDLDEASDFVDRAINQLKARRDRREQAGVLGTHAGEVA